MTPRLVVVLGYSDGGTAELHPICAARLARAAELTTADDVVVLSGWARRAGSPPEAQLMRAAWRGPAREVVVDPDARTTVENLANALNDVVRVGAREVVVVTSSWHARRATAAMRWLLRQRESSCARSRRRARGRAPRCGSCRCGRCCRFSSGRRGGTALRPRPTRLRRGSAASPGATGLRPARLAPRAPRRGSRAPSRPGCPRRCRARRAH